MAEQVVLWKCNEYNPQLVKVVLKKSFDTIGGLEKYVSSGQSVFLKLNLLMKKKPEDAVTTHPAVVEAMVSLLQDIGAKVLIGDSPGGPYNARALKTIYRTAGIEEVAKKTGADLNYDTGVQEISYPEGKVVKRFTLIKPILDADVFISMSKLKTHMMTKFTGAVKCTFGAIPGLTKAEYHLNMPRVADFSNMLLDLNLCTKPVLNVMDAVIGMEGKGPSAGDTREVGAILVSTNAPALDVVATSLVGIKPESIPTIKAASERGLPSHLDQVEILGHSLIEFSIKPFRTPSTTGHARFPIPDLMSRTLEKWLKPKPIFIEDTCIRCQECVKSCPPNALTLTKDAKVPSIDLDKCIRCFCCQELCPQKAVDIKRSSLGKFLFH